MSDLTPGRALDERVARAVWPNLAGILATLRRGHCEALGHAMVRSIHTRYAGDGDELERLWYCDRCEHTEWLHPLIGIDAKVRDDNDPPVIRRPEDVALERDLVAESRAHYERGRQ